MASSTDIVSSDNKIESLSPDETTSLEQFRKLFIGGLNYTTTDEKLKEYCSQYGEMTECVIMRDREGRSRGFAFVSFKECAMVDNFMEHRPHTIDGRKTEPKRAMPRDEPSRSKGQLVVKKIFIGSITEEITEDDLKSHFQTFGNIIECSIIKDREDKLRGFAFITFDDYDAVDRCMLEKPHIINGKELNVRKAIPREQTTTRTYDPVPNNIDFYYQPQIMVNQPTISSSPYAYFYPSKPMSVMNTSHSPSSLNALPPGTLFYPPELANNMFFHNQIYPSSVSARTNNNIQYQNNIRKRIDNEQIAHSNNYANTNHSNPIRTRSRSNNDEQHRKLFIGGLSFKTTDATLKEYVTKFGEVSDSVVMKGQNGQSKCFGFVTFIDPKVVDEFMKQRPHILDGRQIDPKRAMPREEVNNDHVHLIVKKIFIGGIRDGLDEDTLKKYFEQYGIIKDCLLIHNKDGKTRGFAFIEFDDFDSVDKVILARPHTIGEYSVDVKKAIPKDQRQLQAQQQYALQMQAAAAYYYNNLPYNILNNPISSPFITNGGAVIDNVFSHLRISNNNNNIFNPHHYPHRQQSTHDSQ